MNEQGFQENERNSQEINNLLSYIQNNYPKLDQKAKIYCKNNKDPKSSSYKTIHLNDVDLSWGLVANPDDYHGKELVSENLIKESNKLSTTVTCSNIINVLFCSPLFYYAFSFLGNVFSAYIATVLSSVLLLKFSNSTASGVASRKKGNQVSPLIAAIGLLSINGLLTVGSGIGAELWMNESNLVEQFAKEKAEEIIKNKKSSNAAENSPLFEAYESSKKVCTEGEEKLRKARENNINSNKTNNEIINSNKTNNEITQLFLKLYGKYEDYQDWQKGKDLSLIKIETVSSYPDCHKADIYEYYVNKYVIDNKNNTNNLVIELDENNYINFLKKEARNTYDRHFTEDEKFISGSLAIGYALNNLLEQIKVRNYGQIGMSLIFLLISFLTSLVACFWIISYTYSQDYRASYSVTVSSEINNFFNKQLNKLKGDQKYESQLITLYKTKILTRGIGNNDYRPLVKNIEYALLNENRHEIDFKNLSNKKILDIRCISLEDLVKKNISEENENIINKNINKNLINDINETRKFIEDLLHKEEKNEGKNQNIS